MEKILLFLLILWGVYLPVAMLALICGGEEQKWLKRKSNLGKRIQNGILSTLTALPLFILILSLLHFDKGRKGLLWAAAVVWSVPFSITYLAHILSCPHEETGNGQT